MSVRYGPYATAGTSIDARDPVPVELTQAESYTAEIVEIRKDLALVEGVVLPERPESVWAGSICIADDKVFHKKTAETHFILLETKLAEAIAQRDAAQRQTSMVNAENQRIRDAGRTRITELEATLATEREVSSDLRESLSASIADAKLWRDNVATERARALQEAADECQKRRNHLMHEEGHQEGDTGAWVASDRVLDQIEGWDSAKEAILALIQK